MLTFCLSLGLVAQLTAQTPPSIEEASFRTSNANPAYAKVGDTLTLSFIVSTGDESVTPAVMIAGKDARVMQSPETPPAGPQYSATYTVLATDSQGAVTYDIGTVTSASLSGGTLDPPAVISKYCH